VSGLDLLAFGPHPDDVEIGLGGTLAKHAALGHSVGLCDLTRGEMSSNGTPEQRVREAEAARKVLGAAWRENLALPDRAIGTSPDHTLRVVEIIRRVRPRTIAIPYWNDRHPDHESSAAMLRDAVFNAKLKRYKAAGDPWQPETV
jgi:bacillithiol biosynthesis deacetylase BshB1